MCGEAPKATARPPVASQRGLSPHVRGSLPVESVFSVRRGSIPACAGKPWKGQDGGVLLEVYPRMCGEANRNGTWVLQTDGLSPHVRGSHPDLKLKRPAHGSIPACAGKPAWQAQPRTTQRVYPRMCGEAQCDESGRWAVLGLSPHVRGSPGLFLLDSRNVRSIPACAGKPGAKPTKGTIKMVYPRMCGEAPIAAKGHRTVRGLSPHVRGSRFTWQGTCLRDGSIPACAGKPNRPSTAILALRVYPRMCGEACAVRDGAGNARGLSPHVRGSPVGGGGGQQAHGSIPACAGKPDSPLSSRELSRVYPRMCGEALLISLLRSSRTGLSPHVRGSRVPPKLLTFTPGSIPACAGKPACSLLGL